jgi:lysophospholipase L1-like esterase
MVEINTGARRLADVDDFRAKTVSFIDSLNDFIRATCESKMIPLVDLAKAFGAPDRPDLLNPDLNIGDNAHLNLDGQHHMAKVFFEEYFKDAEDFDLVVCLGDSHTQGFPVRDDSRNGIVIDLEIDNPHQYPYWLVKETRRTFINQGLAGNTIYGMKNRFEMDVLSFFPDHCCIQGGTNDSLLGIALEDSKADMLTIINKCLDAEITPVVGTVIPLGF